jgi:cell fate (sporulation/competence/biofilm development) regulator YlbF (YheA/YmcA/DUF963 family)
MDIKRNPQIGATDYLLRLDDGTAITFDTEQEARQAMAKIETAKAVIEPVKAVAETADVAKDRIKEYFDLAGDGWVDADVAALGITAAQLASCITFLENFDKFMTNQVAAQADYTAVLNAVRRVSA